jgi:hypothetical protein
VYRRKNENRDLESRNDIRENGTTDGIEPVKSAVAKLGAADLVLSYREGTGQE